MKNLQSKKIANILGDFRDSNDPNKCLAIIDELGTGTTETNLYDPSGGLGFGTKVLSACSDYDTIISTQITTLAEFAEENLDAVSYMFDDEHNISMGIGKPNLNKLIEETGLSEVKLAAQLGVSTMWVNYRHNYYMNNLYYKEDR